MRRNDLNKADRISNRLMGESVCINTSRDGITIKDLEKIVLSLSVKAEPYHIRAALLSVIEYLKAREEAR